MNDSILERIYGLQRLETGHPEPCFKGPMGIRDRQASARLAYVDAADGIGSVVDNTGSRPLRKIFYLVDSFAIGGTETQAVELALRMSQRGHSVTLGCLRAEGPLKSRLNGSSVEVEEFHPGKGLDSPTGAYELLRLRRFLRKGQFQVVHTHDLWSNLLGIPAAKLAGVRAVISSRRDLGHLDWYQGSRRAWLRWLQNLSNAIVANSEPIRDALIAEDRFPPQKLRVIHNGIDIEKFRRASSAPSVLSGHAGQKTIVLVGNMHSDVKGHPWLVDAARTMIADFPLVRFVFVGDGEKRRDFEELVDSSGMSKNFVFLGHRSDVPQILAGCDIAVLPSLAEGLPNAVLEYMAAGLPTIVSNVGGNAALVRDGATGLLVPPRDSAALSKALLKLLTDPGFAEQIAANGRKFIEQNFSFERLVQQTEQLYTELLEAR